MAPGSCSAGIHILLETLELPFKVWIIDVPAGERAPASGSTNAALPPAGAGRWLGAH
jgi:hypothetical protein